MLKGLSASDQTTATVADNESRFRHFGAGGRAGSSGRAGQGRTRRVEVRLDSNDARISTAIAGRRLCQVLNSTEYCRKAVSGVWPPHECLGQLEPRHTPLERSRHNRLFLPLPKPNQAAVSLQQ